MKLNWKEIAKFWVLMQMPIYSGILWVYLLYGISYWWAVMFTNSTYMVIIYPILKLKIFAKEDKE